MLRSEAQFQIIRGGPHLAQTRAGGPPARGGAGVADKPPGPSVTPRRHEPSSPRLASQSWLVAAP